LKIERRMGLDAVDIYGLSASNGAGRGQRMHRDEGWAVIWRIILSEIITRDRSQVVPDGIEGEAVFTSLTKEACPSSAIELAI